MLAGYLVANATNPNFEEEGYKDKQAELAKLPLHAQVQCHPHDSLYSTSLAVILVHCHSFADRKCNSLWCPVDSHDHAAGYGMPLWSV